MDVPIGTVKSRINRARLQLQIELKHLKKSHCRTVKTAADSALFVAACFFKLASDVSGG